MTTAQHRENRRTAAYLLACLPHKARIGEFSNAEQLILRALVAGGVIIASDGWIKLSDDGMIHKTIAQNRRQRSRRPLGFPNGFFDTDTT